MRRSRESDEPYDWAYGLISRVTHICGSRNFLSETADGLREAGVQKAVEGHDSPALFDWLIDVLSYQGVSDQIAWRYMEDHGRVSWRELADSLRVEATCPKLTSFDQFHGCGYSKQSLSCGEPDLIAGCPLPLHPLRNGRLNQAAYALHLFIRDACQGDLVGWIDQRLAEADDPSTASRTQRMRAALLEPLRSIFGVSDKVLSMALASLLLCGDSTRERWVVTGASMIAIDTLVHNWMHRTGILRELGAEHPYGRRCYGPGGCADIIEEAAQGIDARQLNPDYPCVFPRLVQHAIWHFCAELGFDQCNGRRIDDRFPCAEPACPLGRDCQRLPLHGAYTS